MEYATSIALYVIVFTISFTLITIGHKCSTRGVRRLFVLLGILLPSILAGIRYYVGFDYGTYLGMYNRAEIGYNIYFRSIEPISTMIIELSGALHSSFLMFFLFSLITNLCMYLAFRRFLKDDKKTSLSYLLFLFILYSTTLNAVRSGAAMAIAFLGLSYFYNRDSKRAVALASVLLLLSILTHLSMALMLVFVPAFIYVGMQKERNKKVLFSLWGMSLLVAILLPMIIGRYIPSMGDYARYLTGVGKSFSIPQANILMLFQLAVLIVYNRLTRYCEDDRLAYCAAYYIPLSILAGWITYVDGLSRISFILEPLIICLMASAFIRGIRKRGVIHILTACLIIVISSAMFIRNLYWSGALPYETTIDNRSISYASKN